MFDLLFLQLQFVAKGHSLIAEGQAILDPPQPPAPALSVESSEEVVGACAVEAEAVALVEAETPHLRRAQLQSELNSAQQQIDVLQTLCSARTKVSMR